MFKRILNIIAVSLLSLLLVFGSTAKEFVHLFVHHEDTIHHNDHICPAGETHFEDQHHHCSFLHFVLEPFANDAFVPKIQINQGTSFAVKHVFFTAKFIPCNLLEISLRGPPEQAA